MLKKWTQQVRQYPAAYGVIALAIITLLVAFQFNWAYKNNFWADINTRIVASVFIGLALSLLYARLLIALLSRLTGYETGILHKKIILLQAPLALLWMVAVQPHNVSLWFTVAGAGYLGVLWMLFIYPDENAIKQNIAGNAPFFLMLVAVAASLGARKVFIPQPSMDTVNWVIPWLKYIQKYGFAAYGDAFTNYSPFYTYLLGIFSWLPLTDLEIIKYISISFDLMCAWYISRMVKLRYPASPLMPALAFSAFMLLPTVLINSSYWGQCDIIYVAFCLASMYYLMLPDTRKNNLWAVGLYAVALSVKFQALLFAPLLAIAWFKRDIRLTDFLLIPGVYLVLAIPCLIAGRGFTDVMLVYFNIVDKNPVLTANSPNIYQLVDKNFMFNNAGVLLAFAVQAIIIFTSAWKLKAKAW
ncbi:MAG TPA: hypothetical protein VEC12_06415, partial [Bacteroidia bacterium]|nr:hypothetical protein [Bacteroidia bacterium]